MKLYVVGTVASGKTTLAKKISKRTGIECTHLDGVIHIKDETNKVWGNKRRTDNEIQEMYQAIINQSKWIIEDAGRKIFNEGMEKADTIVHINPSKFIRKTRILTRYLKQKLGLEACLYTPNLRMLKFLFKASKNYDTGMDDLELRLNAFKDKTIVLKTNRDIQNFLNEIS